MATDQRDDMADNGRVGFRDIYRAVGESEARLTLLIQSTLGPIAAQSLDHEQRIRQVENAVRNSESRERGVAGTLGIQRSFLVMICSIVAAAVALFDLLQRFAPAVVPM